MGHGGAVGGQHLVLGPAFAQQGRGLRLGEDHTGAGDRGRLLVHGEGQFADFLDGDREQVGEDLHPAAGARGTLVVHEEGLHLAALVAADGLAVLAAHVQDRANRGAIHEVPAAGVAGDLGQGLVRERHIDAAVAGAHGVVEVVHRQAGAFHGPLDRLVGALRTVEAGALIAEGVELAVREDHRLRADRADVHAGTDDVGVFPVHRLIVPAVLFPAPEFLLFAQGLCLLITVLCIMPPAQRRPGPRRARRCTRGLPERARPIPVPASSPPQSRGSAPRRRSRPDPSRNRPCGPWR